MPHANIWIRKDDWQAWQNVADKPKFLHDALNGRTTLSQEAANALDDALTKAKVPTEDRVGIVEVCNGHPSFRRDCGLIGCGYG